MIVSKVTKKVVQLTLEYLLQSEDFDKILDRLAEKIARSSVAKDASIERKNRARELYSPEDAVDDSMAELAKASSFFMKEDSFSVRNGAFDKSIVKSDKEKNRDVMGRLTKL